MRATNRGETTKLRRIHRPSYSAVRRDGRLVPSTVASLALGTRARGGLFRV